MRVPDHPTLIRSMLQARLKKLATTSPVLAATFGTVQRRCGSPSCRCHHGGPRHTAFQVTDQKHGKKRSVYVPKDLAPEVKAWIVEHHRLKKILREIHELSRALIRGHVRHRKRQQGRP